MFALLLACAQPLAPGEWGTFRWFAELKGEAPMRLLPPATDRDGNVYVLYGDHEDPESVVYTGAALGGWTGGCRAHRGVRGLRGFVGRTDSRMWYWAGDALSTVSGETGACRELLSSDPVTGTGLLFLGVIPRVSETPSHRYLPALVQGASDTTPFYVTVDLDEERYFDAIRFEPEGAETVVVAGTGADPFSDEGVFVVTYQLGEAVTSRAVFVAGDGRKRLRNLEVPEVLEEDSILGFVQFASDGTGAALLDDGRLLRIARGAVFIDEIAGIEAYGVQSWNGTLYLTGLVEGVPSVQKITAQGASGAKAWGASRSAMSGLGNITVLDERSDPAFTSDWSDAGTAIGYAPLLSPWPLDVYTTDSTGWLVAGPAYEAGAEPFTAVAFAPVGVSF